MLGVPHSPAPVRPSHHSCDNRNFPKHCQMSLGRLNHPQQRAFFCCCFGSVMSNSLQPHGLQHCQASMSFTISWSLLKLMSVESVMPSNHLILCRPFLLLPSICPNIKVFSNELALCIRWPKYQSFSISPSSEYSGLISFRIDWFDLLAVQRTLKSLPQRHS